MVKTLTKLDNIFEEAIKDCMQDFRKFENNCENKRMFVREQNRKDEVCLTISDRLEIYKPTNR